jgi:hypothetical protein
MLCGNWRVPQTMSKGNDMSKVFLPLSDDWFKKEGISREPSEWEDGARVDSAPGRFEWWYFDAHLDDGTTVVAVIYTKPYSNVHIPCSPQVKLIITDPAGKTHLRVENLPESQFSAAKETCDVRAGQSWIKGNLQKYTLHVEAGGNAVDLEVVRIVPSWRIGVGKCFFGEAHKDYLGWIVPVPAGRVTGKIKYQGQERPVSGRGYHDHNFGNIALSKILDHWYWGCLSVADYNCIFFQFVSAKKYGSVKQPIFMFAKGDKILIDESKELAVSAGDPIRHSSGKTYPQSLDFVWRDGQDNISVKLSEPKLLESRYLLAELPWYKRAVARLFMNPYYFRFTADLDLHIEHGGVKDTKKDKAIFESMMLR